VGFFSEHSVDPFDPPSPNHIP